MEELISGVNQRNFKYFNAISSQDEDFMLNLRVVYRGTLQTSTGVIIFLGNTKAGVFRPSRCARMTFPA